MHHYVYCIENLVNGKIYIGKHSTEHIDDGYMGSGKLVTRAISKHGLENFRKFIVAELETEEKAYEFERLLVTEEFVFDENTYNLIQGGKGNFAACNHFHKLHPEIKIANGRRAMKIIHENPINQEKASVRMKILHAEGKLKPPNWNGRKHKEETKRKIGETNAIKQSGEGNSQFGTCWISHPELKKSQRVNKSEIERYLSDGWVRGRKMKW